MSSSRETTIPPKLYNRRWLSGRPVSLSLTCCSPPELACEVLGPLPYPSWQAMADVALQLITGHSQRTSLAIYQHVAVAGQLADRYQHAMKNVGLWGQLSRSVDDPASTPRRLGSLYSSAGIPTREARRPSAPARRPRAPP